MQKNQHYFVFLPVLLLLLVVVPCVRVLSRTNERVPGTDGMAEILTPTEGIDFSSFVQAACKTVRQKWYASMPEDAQLGRKGRVVVRFKINKDGTLPSGSPAIEESSGRKDLDGAALSAIKTASPFRQFPQEFAGPNIELRFIFLYNLPFESPKKP